jgi:hypothetical protein
LVKRPRPRRTSSRFEETLPRKCRAPPLMRCSFVQFKSGSHKQPKSICTHVRFRQNGSPTNRLLAFKSTSRTIHLALQSTSQTLQEHTLKQGDRLRFGTCIGTCIKLLQRGMTGTNDPCGPRCTDGPLGRDHGLELSAELPAQPAAVPGDSVLRSTGRVMFLRLERRRSLPILAPREETHKASSTARPRLCLQPGLHTPQGTPLGNHTEQQRPTSAEGTGAPPKPPETQKRG